MPVLNNLPASELISGAVQRTSYLSRGSGTPASRLAARAPVPTPPPLGRPVSARFVCMNVEPEDAKLTGATRSLSRRLLALNMRQSA